MKKLDTRVVALELIVGVGRDETTPKLSYITYKENGKLNSMTSWTQWSENADNPIIVKNRFSGGFKIIGNNHGRGSQCRNTDHMLILHPLSNTTFELEMDNFLELIKYSDIINQTFNEELIYTKKRELISMHSYNEKIKEHDDKDSAITARNNSKVKPKDQKVGGIYINPTTGEKIIYLGTVKVTMKDGDIHIKHCYVNESWRHSNDDYKLRDNILLEYSERVNCVNNKTFIVSPQYCPKGKRALTYNTEYMNVYDSISDEDLDIFCKGIESIFSTTEYGSIRFEADWLKLYDNYSHTYGTINPEQCTIKKITCNFKDEYIAQK